jgi:hypothetical protein
VSRVTQTDRIQEAGVRRQSESCHENRQNSPCILSPVSYCAVLCALAVLAGDPVAAVKPLGERVLIRRYTFGIPHIFAETAEAAGFGLGYAQAEDHLEVLARRAGLLGAGVRADCQRRPTAAIRYGSSPITGCAPSGSPKPTSKRIKSASTARRRGNSTDDVYCHATSLPRSKQEKGRTGV